MAVQDKTLTCRECGDSFTFTAGEQDFFNARGYTNEPSRCPTCRQSRRNERNSGSGSGGGGSYGRADRQMFSTTCAECGKEAQVPFQPRGDRPVYCSDCFGRMGTNRR